MIKAENLSKGYNNLPVLRELNFHAQRGEFVIITGKSGCGKSTLLNVMSCLDSFEGGKLSLLGEDVGEMRPRRLYAVRRQEIGFIFQGYNLISGMNALENVCLPLKYSHTGYFLRKKAAQDALIQVDLKDKMYNLPHQLSGGQQQRVAVARALVTNPKILFCDEPTGNLDAATAQMVLKSIIDLQKNGTTVVMITHDNSLIHLADTAYNLQEGKLHKL
ncbi:MAG: ABC transporter ATP-binding protein [Oscillospiraceae bacterium]